MSLTTNNSMFIKTCFISSEEIEVIIKFPTMKSLFFHGMALVFLNLFFVSTVILNSVAVTTIWKSRVLKEKIPNFVVLIQSAMDLLNGAIFTPLFTAVFTKEISGYPSCMLQFITKKLGSLTLLYSLTAISVMNIDRFLAILFPLFHRANVTKERLTKFVISTSCVQTILLSFTIPYSQTARVLLVGVNTVVIIASTVVTHLSIFVFTIMKKKINTEKKTTEERKKEIKFSKELKAAMSCFLVIVCCVT